MKINCFLYWEELVIIFNFSDGSMVKNLPATWETQVQSLGWEDPLEKGKATHSSILVCIVHGVAKSWTRLSDFTFTFHFHALEKEMATHSSVLAWRIPGTGEPGGQIGRASCRERVLCVV